MALKQVRQRLRLSQSKLAEISGVNIKTIQAYEQDVKNINNARLNILLNLTYTLNCSIADLVTDEELKKSIIKYERRN